MGDGSAALYPVRLTCEYAVNPLGLDVPAPRLSWVFKAEGRGRTQASYQVIVAGSEANLAAGLGDLWDSGRVESGQSAQVVYGGTKLHAGQRCHWRVRVWDGEGRVSDWSAPAWWEMGLLAADNWRAKWIGSGLASNGGPCPHLRKAFDVHGGIRRAKVYATALGLYELYLNGRRVGEDLFTPGWTDYRRRVQYQTYDVTAMLAHGGNTVGAVLGDGWYCGCLGWGGRRNWYGDTTIFLAQLLLEYDDGRTEVIATDESWRWAAGPILAADLYDGEIYDARREMAGWNSPGYDDAGWTPVVARERDEVELVARSSPPVRRMEELPPVGMSEPAPGVHVFDLGQNMVGWARLKVRGSAGTSVTLRHAEMLNPDGTIYTANLRGAKCTDTYILKGGGEEVYEPRFTFHGFRYVEVTGIPGRPSLDTVTGVVAYSALRPAGAFTCSDPMLDRLQQNILWGQRGNFLEVPTDCPQRDERLGWMGDAQVFAPTACLNMDTASFFTKWMRDVTDGQSPEGAFPDVAPRIVNDADGAPGWGDAGVIVPWTVYRAYGDIRIIEEHFPAMARWLAYIQAANPDLLWRERLNNNYGDWLSLSADGKSLTTDILTPKDLLATAYFANSARLLARMAAAIDRHEEADRYERLFQEIKAAFVQAYVMPDGRLLGDTQTCYVLALRFALLPEDLRTAAAAHLAADIETRGWHLSTGFLGVGHLLPVLSDAGHLDAAYRLLTSDTYPSWGYTIKQGATTIWERWDGWTAAAGFQDPGMNSFNHYSLGAVGEWLYTAVAGIAQDPDVAGYKRIVIRPRPGGGLTYARAEYDSIHGRIVSDWRIEEGVFRLKVSIPANTSAMIHVPAREGTQVLESGKPVDEAEGVAFVRRGDGEAVFEVGSGEYEFVSG